MSVEVEHTLCRHCYHKEQGRWGYCYNCGSEDVFWHTMSVFIPEEEVQLKEMEINFEIWTCSLCEEEVPGYYETCPSCGSDKMAFNRIGNIKFDPSKIHLN